MTIGGNDVNYLGSLDMYSCLDSGGSSCGTVDQDAITAGLRQVGASIGSVIDAVHARAPQARVLVVDYLTILPTRGGLCAGVPMSASHLAFARRLRAGLDAVTSSAAAAHGATLIDVAAGSIDHHACAAVSWVEKYTVADGHTPYHPTPAGMTAVADSVLAEL